VFFRLLRVVAVLAAVVALAGPAFSMVTGMASAGSDCASTGHLLRYVVLFDAGVPAPQAARAVRAACGITTAYYPQIGVGVATSAEPTFRARFGVDRAYSAQAEALASTQPAELSSPMVPPTAARAPEAAQALRIDRSAEQWDMAQIHAPQARMINRGSPEVLVGVLDSGIDATHPDLAAAVDPTRSAGCLSGKPDQSRGAWSPSTSAHGTHVAGTIAAADNGRGITGVAPGVRLASVKVVDDDGFIYPEYVVCGFMWAARQQMRIANSSYSLDPWLLTCSDVPGQAVAYEAVRRAVQYATAQGVLSIAAAGNERMDLANPRQDLRSPDNVPDPRPRPVDQHCNVLPAELPGVVAVSAIGAQRVKAAYSSYGSGVVAVTAPGGDWAQPLGVGSSGCVLSTVPGGYGYLCGTSMATPHATGVAALLASVRPEAGPQQLATLLRDQADPLPCPARSADGDGLAAECAGDAFYGHGVVDALKAVTTQPAAAGSDAAARSDSATVVRSDRTQR
jgi:subtilisin family serine protease